MLGYVAITGERILSGGRSSRRERDYSKRPCARYTVGRDAAIIARHVRSLSDRMLDSLLIRGLKHYFHTTPSTTSTHT